MITSSFRADRAVSEIVTTTTATNLPTFMTGGYERTKDSPVFLLITSKVTRDNTQKIASELHKIGDVVMCTSDLSVTQQQVSKARIVPYNQIEALRPLVLVSFLAPHGADTILDMYGEKYNKKERVNIACAAGPCLGLVNVGRGIYETVSKFTTQTNTTNLVITTADKRCPDYRRDMDMYIIAGLSKHSGDYGVNALYNKYDANWTDKYASLPVLGVHGCYDLKFVERCINAFNNTPPWKKATECDTIRDTVLKNVSEELAKGDKSILDRFYDGVTTTKGKLHLAAALLLQQ